MTRKSIFVYYYYYYYNPSPNLFFP